MMFRWIVICTIIAGTFGLGCKKAPEKLKKINISASMKYAVPLGDTNDKPEYGNIGNDRAFCADIKDGFFIQVDLGSLITITKLQIQGFNFNGTNYHIPAFTILFSFDNHTWHPYTYNDMVRLFLVNRGSNGNDFIFEQPLRKPALIAQYVRLYPKMNTKNIMCLRFDYFGCSVLSPIISTAKSKEIRINNNVNLICNATGKMSMVLEWKHFPQTASNITASEKSLIAKILLNPTMNDGLKEYNCNVNNDISFVKCSRDFYCRSYYMFHQNLKQEKVTQLVVNIALPANIENFVATYKNSSGVMVSWKRPALNDIDAKLLNYSLTCNMSGTTEPKEIPLRIESMFLKTSEIYKKYQCQIRLKKKNYSSKPYLPEAYTPTNMKFTSLSLRPNVKLLLDVNKVSSRSVRIRVRCNFTNNNYGSPNFFMINATLYNYGELKRPVMETWKQDVNKVIKVQNIQNRNIDSLIDIKGLKPWSEYKIKIAILNNDKLKSNYSVVTVKTNQDRPDAGPSLEVHIITKDYITLSIKKLELLSHNGKLRKFELFIKPVNKTMTLYVINDYDNFFEVKGLESSRNYSFQCRAKTDAGFGPYGKEIIVSTKSGPPFAPFGITSIQDSPLKISWTAPKYFGPIKGYNIKVIFVNKTNKIFISNKNRLKFSFTFPASIVESVAVQSFTSTHESKWSNPFDVNSSTVPNLYKRQTALIIGFSVAFAVFAVFVVLCFIYFKRHYQTHAHQIKDYQLDSMLNSREVHVYDDDMESDMYIGSTFSGHSSDTSTCNLPVSTHDPLPVEEFSDYINTVKQEEYRILLEDFRNQMPTGKCYSWTIADLPENTIKNRYQSVCAYDHSRIVLKVDTTERTDYVNANSIYGFKKHEDGRYKYIATQGPTEHTLADFWHMVWQEGCNIIVMLSNLKENDKVKCAQYWPHESSKEYGDISVTLDKIDKTADYITRTFQLEQINTKEQRTVRQFHFVPWPDHGVPDYPTALLSLRRRVRHYYDEDKPMVVHCSAGIGRTGCYILIDAMLERIDNEKTVDIFNYLNYMRTRRICMVQTPEQYIFAHIAVLEYITYGNTETFVGELDKKFKELVRGNGMHEEFAVLERNRISDISPGNVYNVLLREGKFIEAYHVDGFKQRDAFILTKAPSEDNIIDFWKMVLEKQVHTIVMLNKTQEPTQEYFKYWPDVDGHNAYQDIAVMLNSEIANGNIMTRKIKVTTNNRRCEVNHFQFVDWPDSDIPDQRDYNNICTLMQAVEKSQHNLGNGPIIVHSGNDYGRSGTFIAIYNSTERLKVEQLIDVLQCVRSIRITQPLAVDNVNQYQFIYDSLRTYLEGFENYCNYKEYNVCRSPFASTYSCSFNT